MNPNAIVPFQTGMSGYYEQPPFYSSVSGYYQQPPFYSSVSGYNGMAGRGRGLVLRGYGLGEFQLDEQITDVAQRATSMLAKISNMPSGFFQPLVEGEVRGMLASAIHASGMLVTKGPVQEVTTIEVQDAYDRVRAVTNALGRIASSPSISTELTYIRDAYLPKLKVILDTQGLNIADPSQVPVVRQTPGGGAPPPQTPPTTNTGSGFPWKTAAGVGLVGILLVGAAVAWKKTQDDLERSSRWEYY